ncbi:MAG: HPr family phosphocarrier protein [Candidatus Coatesbacteria bacterium]|nr:HPr family phosphocarrier protein [Candidatus Coatesbacteria bacterium]
MKEIELVIPNKLGIHMRPAAMLVDEASKYSSEIEIEFNGIKANAKSLLNIVMLVLEYKAKIIVRAMGEDEEKAIIGLKTLIENGFGEK